MNKPSPDLYIGTMSGTSMNGIDVCAISMSDRTPKLIAFASYNYPPKLSAELFELIKAPSMHLDSFGKLNFQIGRAFASAIERFISKNGISPNKIKGIGLSGKTVFHSPKGPAPF